MTFVSVVILNVSHHPERKIVASQQASQYAEAANSAKHMWHCLRRYDSK
jgi:hypothetical protein